MQNFPSLFHTGALVSWCILGKCCLYKCENDTVTESCPTLCDIMDYSPPGSSVHRILQGRKLEWVAIPFSRGSSQPRD